MRYIWHKHKMDINYVIPYIQYINGLNWIYCRYPTTTINLTFFITGDSGFKKGLNKGKEQITMLSPFTHSFTTCWVGPKIVWTRGLLQWLLQLLEYILWWNLIIPLHILGAHILWETHLILWKKTQSRQKLKPWLLFLRPCLRHAIFSINFLYWVGA